MDILSEVLRVVRLSGAVHFLGTFSEPWSFTSSPPDLLAARLKLPQGSVTPFHVLLEGDCWVRQGALPPVRLEPGDVTIFPRADQHTMASGLDVPPVPIRAIYLPSPNSDVTAMTYGGSGRPSRFICGYLQADHQFDPLLNSLPSLICILQRQDSLIMETVDIAGRQTHHIDQPRAVSWWRATLDYMVQEACASGGGGRAIVARLAESLFVEVMRWQLHYASMGHGGWLAGLHDPHVGRVLALLHAQPDRPWTVEELAREAGLSRAALAKRFVSLVGQSPIQYLTCWRIHLARHLLAESALRIGEISARVGYESEAAFNRAFRRLMGAPPATWRRSREDAPRLAS